MKKIYIIAIIYLLGSECHAQVNLVQNGSFEEFSVCPTMPGQIQLVKYWWSAGDTPEYFNACSNSSVNVPNTLVGFQYAKTGNAFIGLSLWCYNQTSREYIQTKLSQPLIKDKKYCIKFYINLSDSSCYGIDMIGAYLSIDSIKASDSLVIIEKTPQILNYPGNILKDTIEWILISGEYIAKGNEQFLTIGNFLSDNNVNHEAIKNDVNVCWGFAYYFIDDVSVYECDDTTTNNLSLFNAFTPNGDGVNDIFKVHGQNIKTITGKIINRWGQELFKWSNVDGGWDGKYKGKEVSAGVYFYVVSVVFEDGKMEEKNGSLKLTR